jgi:hypothetical protein
LAAAGFECACERERLQDSLAVFEVGGLVFGGVYEDLACQAMSISIESATVSWFRFGYDRFVVHDISSKFHVIRRA